MVYVKKYDIDWYEPAWYALVQFPGMEPCVLHLSTRADIARDMLRALIDEDDALVGTPVFCETEEKALSVWGKDTEVTIVL